MTEAEKEAQPTDSADDVRRAVRLWAERFIPGDRWDAEDLRDLESALSCVVESTPTAHDRRRAPQPTEDERRIPGFAERERGAQAAWEFFARDDRDVSRDFRAGYHQGTIDEARRRAPQPTDDDQLEPVVVVQAALDAESLRQIAEWVSGEVGHEQTAARLTLIANRHERLAAGFRRAPAEPAAPPAYLALDLWQALNLPVSEFGAYFERNRWADTWANLLDRVRRLSGRKDCPVMVDGEGCELMNGHAGPHMGASDVGSSEPLPVGAPAEPAVTDEMVDIIQRVIEENEVHEREAGHAIRLELIRRRKAGPWEPVTPKGESPDQDQPDRSE